MITTLKKKWLISAISAIVIFFALGIYFIAANKKTAEKNSAVQPTLVSVETLQSHTLPIAATASGYLKAIADTAITPRVSGYIRSIPFHAGAQIQKGQTLFQLDNSKEQAALMAAKANDALSQFQYHRDKRLLKKGFITEDQYYTAKVTMQQNAAALQTAQTNLADKTITAPFTGTLGNIAVSIGDYVAPGTTLSRLVNTQQLQIDYSLPAQDLNKLGLNQPVEISSDASQATQSAHVSYIAPTIDNDTQTIHLQAAITNDTHAFKPGEFVTITQQLGINHHALLVPEQSVLGAVNGYFVYVDRHDHAKQLPVTIGSHYDGRIHITSGLKAGEQVIIAGQNEIHDGQAILIAKNDRKSKQ